MTGETSAKFLRVAQIPWYIFFIGTQEAVWAYIQYFAQPFLICKDILCRLRFIVDEYLALVILRQLPCL